MSCRFMFDSETVSGDGHASDTGAADHFGRIGPHATEPDNQDVCAVEAFEFLFAEKQFGTFTPLRRFH